MCCVLLCLCFVLSIDIYIHFVCILRGVEITMKKFTAYSKVLLSVPYRAWLIEYLLS